MKDLITEMLVGEDGAIRCAGKFYIMPTSGKIKDIQLTLVACVVLTPEPIVLPENEEHSEMWEGEIIIIPKRKNTGKLEGKKKQYAFNGWKVSQVLTGNFGDPELWGPEYFKKAQKGERAIVNRQ